MDENQTSNENQINPDTQPTVINPESPAPEVPQTQSTNPSSSSQSPPVVSGGEVTTAPPKKRLAGLKALPLAIGTALLLVGGSAAAYLGVVLPNKPENVLKAAFENTAKQSQVNFNGIGKFESTKPDADIKAFNIEFNGKADNQKNVFQAEMKFTASGVSLPVELRKVDTSLYLRIGDLKTIQNLAGTALPEYAQLIALFGDKISNQWIEIDETLLKQSGANCTLNTSYALTEDDIKIIKSRYETSPFAEITSSSSELVNGKSAYKYEININADSANEFSDGLEDLSFVKALKECSKDETPDTNSDTKAEDTNMTIWVDKSTKNLVKLRSDISEQESDKSDLKGFIEITMNYQAVTVEKPEGARPAMEIISELQTTLMSQSGQSAGLVQGVFDFAGNNTDEL